MSNGYSGASRHLCRRRRWLAQLPEESPPAPIQPLRRARAEASSGETVVAVRPVASTEVSSLIPRQTWALSLLIGCGLLTWAGVIGVGIWLDLNQLDPWRDIFGLQSGRLLRFFNTTAFLTCSQLSFLILWRRSRSRKDFSGRYRVWFWVGAVCSLFCVATVTRFHERWSSQLTAGTDLVWVDAGVISWMMPATTMLLSAIHLMRRDMPFRSVSRQWVRASRILAVIAGVNLLIGSLVWPVQWATPIGEALCALWPAVFASSLLIHARFVTYVTNEASREPVQLRKPSRWEMRVKAFARHVALMASEEWQIQRARRAAAKAAKAEKSSGNSKLPVPSLEPPAARSPSLAKRRHSTGSQLEVVPTDETPVSKAVNPRPLSRPPEEQAAAASPLTQPVHVHPAQPIPPPHFEINAGQELSEEELNEPMMVAESESASNSNSIPVGYTPEQWRSLSKKERKRLLRADATR